MSRHESARRASRSASAAPAAPAGFGEQPAAGRRWRRWIALIGFWTLLGVLSGVQVSYLFWRYDKMPPGNVFAWQMIDWYFWIPATPVILWLGRRFALERGAWPRNAAVHLAAAIAISVVHLANSTLVGRLVDAPNYKSSSFYEILEVLLAKYIHLDIFTYGAILTAGLAYGYYSQFRREQLVAAKLESELAQAELQALKMQLHPHFLFNTLHAIGVLVRKRESDQAVRMLTGLSELLRAALDTAGRQLVPLRQEIAFLDRYLGIEQIRFQDRLTVRTRVELAVLDAEVPNLLLQPLAENAIRHGIAPRAEGGAIELCAGRRGDRLWVELRDDGVGLSAHSPLASVGSVGSGGASERGERGERGVAREGVGLGNVRARLEQLYPGEHRFEIADRDDTSGVVVTIEIPLAIPRPRRGDDDARGDDARGEPRDDDGAADRESAAGADGDE